MNTKQQQIPCVSVPGCVDTRLIGDDKGKVVYGDLLREWLLRPHDCVWREGKRRGVVHLCWGQGRYECTPRLEPLAWRLRLRVRRGASLSNETHHRLRRQFNAG